MARVTVEDCILKVPNRFELVLLSAQRARDVAGGAQLTVDRDNDKNPVVALREIADETIGLDTLQENLIKGMQKHVEIAGRAGSRGRSQRRAHFGYCRGARARQRCKLTRWWPARVFPPRRHFHMRAVTARR